MNVPMAVVATMPLHDAYGAYVTRLHTALDAYLARVAEAIAAGSPPQFSICMCPAIGSGEVCTRGTLYFDYPQVAIGGKAFLTIGDWKDVKCSCVEPAEYFGDNAIVDYFESRGVVQVILLQGQVVCNGRIVSLIREGTPIQIDHSLNYTRLFRMRPLAKAEPVQ